MGGKKRCDEYFSLDAHAVTFTAANQTYWKGVEEILGLARKYTGEERKIDDQLSSDAAAC
jgi:hypothetical protein